MPLESAPERISDFNEAWPLGTDQRSVGDDHFRQLKDVLRNMDPNLNAGGLAQFGMPGTFGVPGDNDWTGKGGYVIAVTAGEDGWEHATVESLFSSATKKTSVNIWVPGLPTASALVAGHLFDKTVIFPAGLSGSQALAIVAPVDGSPQWAINKNGSGVGTVDWTVAAQVGAFTFASPVTFNAGDYLTIVTVNPADAAMADIMITLQGDRP